MKQLTAKQALAEGYTHYGSDQHDFQSLSLIEDFQEDEDDDTIHLLAEKEPHHHTMSAQDLMDFAIDDYYNDEHHEADDTREVERLVKKEHALFQEVADKINTIYQSCGIYSITNIQLVHEARTESSGT